MKGVPVPCVYACPASFSETPSTPYLHPTLSLILGFPPVIGFAMVSNFVWWCFGFDSWCSLLAEVNRGVWWIWDWSRVQRSRRCRWSPWMLNHCLSTRNMEERGGA
ncbi:hypothetical protein L1987_25149 [Smallanthus sonchifolius]|uniref:Uncharacterized protein n=1 Tax=Smallanthus sonchifolius TaxID=185202 RepID=A0ACB9IML7_9ASTR|nr:hypothetical protein L1987_25149 [Smallanthus sonchifolius]